MSLSTTVIVQGKVSRLSERSGVSKTTNQPYRIVSAIVIGDLTMGEVTLPDTITVQQGQQVTLLCEVSTFRDDDQLRAVQLLDPAAK